MRTVRSLPCRFDVIGNACARRSASRVICRGVLQPAVCCAAERPSESSVGAVDTTVEFTYRSTDGRVKATLEQVFNDPSKPVTDAPWQFSWQMNEKALVWHDDLKSRLITRITAQELGLAEDEMVLRLEELSAVLPDLPARLPVIKPALLARMCADTRRVAASLLALREIFPRANVGLMALRCPGLALGDIGLEGVRQAAEQLRMLLPRSNVDKLVEEHPATMLDIEGFTDALDKAHSMLPGLDVERVLAFDPSFIFGFQRGSKLIPYDADWPELQEDE